MKNEEIEFAKTCAQQEMDIRNKVAAKIKQAKTADRITLGERVLDDGEKAFYASLHDRFAELEQQGDPKAWIIKEANNQRRLHRDNPVETGILVTVLNNRCWLHLNDKNLCKVYQDIYYGLHYAVMEHYDNKPVDDWFSTYMSIVD